MRLREGRCDGKIPERLEEDKEEKNKVDEYLNMPNNWPRLEKPCKEGKERETIRSPVTCYLHTRRFTRLVM
jgi:hypothetical protein